VSAPVVLVPGAVFAHDFRIERLLAVGGMGAVYVASQLSTGRERALKVLMPRLAESTDAKRRFEQEAWIGGQIESEHVVEVVAAGVDATSGAPWLAMELLHGETLAALLERRGRLDAATTLELFAQLAHAMGAAHEKAIVHRDLKPENLFLETGRRAGGAFTLRVLDFGIAKLHDQAARASTGAIGTPLWMAPEQAQSGQPVTPATDVWAMGLIAFRVLSGRCFWRAASDAEAGVVQVLGEMMVEPIPRASDRARELGASPLPPGFDGWFARCTHREPTRRYPNATTAHQALTFVLSPGPQSTIIAPSAVSAAPARRGSRGATAVGVAALAITLGGVATIVVVSGAKRDDARGPTSEESAPFTAQPTASASAIPAAASAIARASATLDDDTIVIAECDEYMRLWRACYKDPITRARADTGFKNMTADYKKLAAGTPKEREDTRAMCEDSVKKFPHALCR
jgi:serine/threonine protein kinase